jgi:hypothetical protein
LFYKSRTVGVCLALDQHTGVGNNQYESARIVTGLRKGTSMVKLYGELGRDSLQNRRKKRKLILMFKALQGELPNYKTINIISYINIEPNYMVRNPRFFTPPQFRTKSYKDSFFPTVLDLWNKLDNDTRNIQKHLETFLEN